MTSPVTGIPVYRLPPELLASPKDATQTINLSMLGQPRPEIYRLAPRDVLGIWIEGVTGSGDTPVPVRYPSTEGVNRTASIGLPFEVRPDGTIHLPIVGSLSVEGLTVDEVRQLVRQAFTVDTPMLKPGSERIYVSLAQPRQYDVMIFRQEVGAAPDANMQAVNQFKRGTAYRLTLPAYENDVLRVLSESGGMPGLDAYNAIYVFRNRFADPAQEAEIRMALESGVTPDNFGTNFVYIPLRTPAGSPPSIRPEDVILGDGDVVFVEAREADVYYTGGLLPTRQFLLPHESDLDVLEAIANAGGPVFTGGLTPAGFILDRQMLDGQIGGPSPSMAIVLRRLPDGRQVPIRVDLNKAMQDPHERIIIQAQDMIVLQQTPHEAIARHIFGALRLNFVWQLFNRGDASASATAITPLEGAPTIVP